VRVGVEGGAAAEAEQGDPRLLREVHGEGRGRRDGRERRDAGHVRLLHQLERGAARDLEHGGAQGQEVLPQGPAHDLVHGVVPPHVLPHAQQLGLAGTVAVGAVREAEEPRGVDAAGRGEQLLPGAQPVRQGEQRGHGEPGPVRGGVERGDLGDGLDGRRAADPARRRRVDVPLHGGVRQGDPRREPHLHHVVGPLPVRADAAAVVHLHDLGRRAHHALGDEEPGHEVEVVTRGAHRDGERPAVEPDLQGLLTGQGVRASGPAAVGGVPVHAAPLGSSGHGGPPVPAPPGGSPPPASYGRGPWRPKQPHYRTVTSGEVGTGMFCSY